MAAANRSSEPSVSDRLRAEPYTFNFYQLVRLLEMLRPNATPVGTGADPKLEPVRFRSSFSLVFPASEVTDLQESAPTDTTPAGGSESPPEVTVSFLGLGGAQGPLPHPLTEWVLERNAVKDLALRDFLDIFNHRLVSLLYRVRRHTRLGMEWTSPEEHHFASYLRALMGMLTAGLQDRLAIPDRALLRYTGILTKQPRDAVGLQTLLSDYFAMPVRCLQLRGAMRALDSDQWTLLGRTGRNHGLGINALLGTAVWDQQAGVELELGPVPWASYLDFLPGQASMRALGQLVRFYLGPGLDVHITLLLQAEAIPPARLGAAAPGAVLGLTTFLASGAPLAGHHRINMGVIAQYSQEPQRTAP